MARVLVYNCSGELDDVSHLFPNERLARIAAIARAAGCEVDLIDRANIHDLQQFGSGFLKMLSELPYHETNEAYEAGVMAEADMLASSAYAVIFLNLWHGTGFKFSMDLAAELKRRHPAVRIFGVGQKVDWFREHILTLPDNALDGLVLGLGYNAVQAIIAGEELSQCPNLILQTATGVVVNAKEPINVDDYPAGCYDPTVYRHIAAKLPIHTITLSNQGCPNECIFCVRPENYGQVNIRRSIARVLEEMTDAYARYGITHFRIEDSTPPQHALTELARAIVDSPLAGKITFSAFARIDTNSTEDFAVLKQAGCLALFFGIESLDEETLQRLRKGFTPAMVRDTVTRAHAAGLRTIGSFIIPAPGASAASVERTLERLGEMRTAFDSILALPAGVYPPTDWGKNPEQHGIKLDDDYLVRFLTFPIRYLLPFKYWPAAPFTYSINGLPAEEVSHAMILELFEGFLARTQRNFGIPCIPDYYFLVADAVDVPYPDCTRQIVMKLIERDYSGLADLLHLAPVGAGV